MANNLLREYVNVVLDEAAIDPLKAAGTGLGLRVFESGDKKTLVMFDIKEAALAIVRSFKAGKTKEDDLMTALEPVVIGYLQAKSSVKGEQWGVLTVTSSAAKKGHGPLMYDIAMSLWGVIAPDRRHVSPSASKIWDYYASKRPDVKKLPFDNIEDPKTPQKKDDAMLNGSALESPLNAAYTGASVDHIWTTTKCKQMARVG